MIANAYPYSGPSRLEERKPYNFAPYQGPTFLTAFADQRRSALGMLAQFVEQGQDALSGRYGLAWLGELDHLDEREEMPAPDVATREALGEARGQWRAELGEGGADSALVLARILRPLLRQGAGLRSVDGDTAWAAGLVRQLGHRFDATGVAPTRHDAEGRPAGGDPGDGASLMARLALATAWVAWDERHRDEASSLSGLNRLLKACDLLCAGLAHGGWELRGSDALWAAAALRLERRLLARWAERAGAASA